MKSMWSGLMVMGFLAAGAADARAQSGIYHGYFTPFLGVSAGGAMADPVITFGASVSVHGLTGWGAEIDAGFANDNNAQNREADMISAMVNLKWVKPAGRLRPFGVGGAGVLAMHGCLSQCPQVISVTDFGLNAGGGAYYTVSDVVGLRGDARYIWAPGDHPNRPDNYGFWRVTVGVTLMWPIVP